MIDTPTPASSAAGTPVPVRRRRLRSGALAGAALFSMLALVASTGAAAVSTRTPAALAPVSITAASAAPASAAAPSLVWSSPLGSHSPVAADDPTANADLYTWGVDPQQKDKQAYRANFAFDLTPGQEVKDAFRVHNRSGGVIELRVYATDAYNSPTGALDLLAGDQEAKDVGSWISMEPTTIKIAPAERREFPFTLRAPSNAEPGDHVGGIVTSLISEQDGPAQVTVDRRAATRVQVRVAGPLNPQLAISNLTTKYDNTWNPLGAGTMNVSFTVKNVGNVRMGASQHIKAKSPIGFPARSYRPDPVPELLPGSEIQLSYDVGGVWPTFRTSTKVTLEAVPTVTNDNYNVTEAGASAKTGNWTIPFALIIAAILAFIGYRIYRERQRRQRLAEEQRLQDLVVAAMDPSGDQVDPAADPNLAGYPMPPNGQPHGQPVAGNGAPQWADKGQTYGGGQPGATR